jgi:hypothetical protein
MMATRKRRVIRAGGWALVKRLIKPVPVIGSIFAVGLAGYEIRKKGLFPGVVHVGLDVTPVVGTAKNVVEIFTGDIIPDKASKSPQLPDASQVKEHSRLGESKLKKASE